MISSNPLVSGVLDIATFAVLLLCSDTIETLPKVDEYCMECVWVAEGKGGMMI